MRYIAVGLLALPSLLGAQSSRWFHPKGYSVAVDTTTIEVVDSTTVHAWIKVTPERGSDILGGKKFEYMLSQMVADCGSRKLGAMSTAYYDSAGKVLASSRPPYPELQTPAPDSNGELWYQMICLSAELNDKVNALKIKM